MKPADLKRFLTEGLGSQSAKPRCDVLAILYKNENKKLRLIMWDQDENRMSIKLDVESSQDDDVNQAWLYTTIVSMRNQDVDTKEVGEDTGTVRYCIQNKQDES